MGSSGELHCGKSSPSPHCLQVIQARTSKLSSFHPTQYQELAGKTTPSAMTLEEMSPTAKKFL